MTGEPVYVYINTDVVVYTSLFKYVRNDYYTIDVVNTGGVVDSWKQDDTYVFTYYWDNELR